MTTLDFRPPAFAGPASTDDPFAARFGGHLPRGLRAEAAGMTWEAFEAAYADGPRTVTLDRWATHRLGATQFVFDADVTLGGAHHAVTTTASGPIAALTGVLYDLGVNIEILELHQQRVGDRTATFIRAELGEHRRWGMGLDTDGTGSALRAVVAAANLLAG